MELRQPVVVVLGHVDSGKTSLLDKIRGTAVQAREVGGITQHIGASYFPIETIKEITGPLYAKLAKAETPIPGLLVIDTPGHEVFANLRARGGSAADIAIVVVDVNKGFEAQTIESIEILKKRKVPFVVALNKVDMVSGWRASGKFVSEEVKKQEASVQTLLDEKRNPRDKFQPVTEVIAAAGLKITSPDLEGVLPGSPLYVYDQKKGEDELEHLKSLVESEIKNAIVSNTETTGIVLKCDTIGSLEAITE